MNLFKFDVLLNNNKYIILDDTQNINHQTLSIQYINLMYTELNHG